jgi:uncharacterized protein (TIGR02145 family)
MTSYLLRCFVILGLSNVLLFTEFVNANCKVVLIRSKNIPEGGIKIGAGWDFKSIFSGGNGILYAITHDNELLYYKHNEKPTGERQFSAAGIKIGSGWKYKKVFSGGNGIIYAINNKYELLYFRHSENPSSPKSFVEAEIKIGTGWDFKDVFSGGNGIIYAIKSNNDLIYYKHIDNPTSELNFLQPGFKIGAGWDFKQVFSGTNNILFAVNNQNDLLYYEHKANPTQEKQFTVSGELFENGWDFPLILSGGYGIVYAITDDKDLLYYDSMEMEENQGNEQIAQETISKIPTIPFKTVTIGSQIWMAENLNVDRFRNGDIIPEVKNDREWEAAANEGKPAWCYYSNNSSHGEDYGKLYNWFAVNDPRGIAPIGWHVPTINEWRTLVKILGGENIAGSKLKSNTAWGSYGNGNNSSGFSAKPTGQRFASGFFEGLGNYCSWWSTSSQEANTAFLIKLDFTADVWENTEEKICGTSLRCVKD